MVDSLAKNAESQHCAEEQQIELTPPSRAGQGGNVRVTGSMSP